MSTYKCTCCNRAYHRKTYYDKHILLCHLMATKSIDDMKKADEELADTPDVRVLYEIILEMNAKMTKMESKLEEYEKWVESKKRKINIIDWLNDKYKEYPIVYTPWLNSIIINRAHLEMIFEYDYVAGMVSIMQSLLPHDSSSPIKCFDQKENVLFIYNDHKWSIMSSELFEKLIASINTKIIGEFILWQNENEEKIHQDDNFANVYAHNLKKIMGGNGNSSLDVLGLKIKKELFKYLKVNIKNVMEIELI